MLDFSGVKGIVIPEGEVVKIEVSGTILWKKEAKNWVPYSTTTDGKTIFNGTGYKNNTRLNSSAEEVALTGYVTTGYIPAKAGDDIRVKGITWDSTTNKGGYFWTYDSGFAKLKNRRPGGGGSQNITFTVDTNGIVTFHLAEYDTSVAYIRFSAYGTGENLVVTVSEEIE